MRFEDMTPEMIEKIRGCETDEERRAVLEENGIELDDEQLDGIAGGRVVPYNYEPPVRCKHSRRDDGKHFWGFTGIVSNGGMRLFACVWCGETAWSLPRDCISDDNKNCRAWA